MCNIVFLLFIIISLLPSYVNTIVYGDYTSVSRYMSAVSFPEADADNEMRGFASFDGGFTFESPSTSALFNAFYPLSGSITLTGGILTLSQDLQLLDGAEMMTGGTIEGNCHVFTWQSDSPVNIPVDVYSADELVMTDVKLSFNMDVNLYCPLRFQGACVFNCNDYGIAFCEGGSILVDSNSSLLLENVTMSNITNTTIQCLDSNSTLSMRNVVWIQDYDFTFALGHIDIVGDVAITGAHQFVYQSDQVSTIHENSTLFFDSGMTFSYGAASARNLISFIDSTSRLHFYETSIYSVAPDLQLTKGTVIVEGECSVDSAAMTGAWSDPPTLSQGGQPSAVPQVAMDTDGNAMAVWRRRNDGVNYTVQASYYDGTWSSPATDLSEAGQTADNPQVAMDPAGNAMAVWQRSDGINTIIQASYYDGTWSTATDLSEAGEDAKTPQVAMDLAGNAMAVWSRWNGSNWIVQASYYDGTWSTTTDVSVVGKNALVPQVAMNLAGNAMAVWRRYDGPNYIIQASYYDGTWSTPTDLSEADQNPWGPQVAMDPAGNAIAIWQRSDGINVIIQASYYNVSTGAWSSPPTDLSEAGADAYEPQVAMDPAGNAMAVWRRFSDPKYRIQASSYNVSACTWYTPICLSRGVEASAYTPQVAMDPVGNAMVVWQRWGAIQASYYNAATILDDGICLGDENNSVNLKILPESGFNIRSGYLVYKNVV